MAVLPIAIYPDPVLRTVAAPVTTITPQIQRLLDDMLDTMRVAPGVGLAGPQVSQSLRVIVVEVRLEVPTPENAVSTAPTYLHHLYQLINPEIIRREGTITWNEGCLSLPELLVDMERAEQVLVAALDRAGAPITIDAHGLLSVVLQHEIDHLDGKLIIDGLSRLKRNRYLEKLKKRVPE